MQQSTLQSMMALNASNIANRDIQIGFNLDQARWQKNKGNISIAADNYREADKERKKKAKAVALQYKMKAELMALQATTRIANKAEKLYLTVGMLYTAPSLATTVEKEAALDLLIEQHIPKKPDSRITKAA